MFAQKTLCTCVVVLKYSSILGDIIRIFCLCKIHWSVQSLLGDHGPLNLGCGLPTSPPFLVFKMYGLRE